MGRAKIPENSFYFGNRWLLKKYNYYKKDIYYE